MSHLYPFAFTTLVHMGQCLHFFASGLSLCCYAGIITFPHAQPPGDWGKVVWKYLSVLAPLGYVLHWRPEGDRFAITYPLLAPSLHCLIFLFPFLYLPNKYLYLSLCLRIRWVLLLGKSNQDRPYNYPLSIFFFLNHLHMSILYPYWKRKSHIRSFIISTCFLHQAVHSYLT